MSSLDVDTSKRVGNDTKPAMSDRQHTTSKGNILIVDDCPENLSLLSLLLARYGYTTQLATSGSLALSMMQESLPDLVLLDVMMPEMDGYEVCHALKEQEKTREIPVIFVSALQEAESKVRAFSVGAADFLSKPFKVPELVARIEHQLQLVRLQIQLNHQTEQLVLQNQQLQQEIAERKVLEEALKGSENELRGLFAALQDVVLVLDDAGNYLKVAPTRVAHHLLYQPTELLEGRNLYETFTPQEAHEFLRQIHRSLSTQSTIDHEYRLVISEQTLWFSAKISPISQTSVIWVARDITDRKVFELELLEKSQSLATFSRSLKQLHHLQMQSFASFQALCENFIQAGCQILGFSAGAVGHVQDETYTFLSVQSDLESLVPNLEVNLGDTFCSKVVERHGTVAFQHIHENLEMRCHPLHQTLKLESYLGTPIFAQGELFGTLCFFSNQPRHQGFAQYEVEMIELMAQTIGKYISAHQNDCKRRQAEEEVQLLLNLTQAIAAAPDFDQALETALQSLCEATGWSYGQVWLPSVNGQVLECSSIGYYNEDGRDREAIATVEQFRRSWCGATCCPGEGVVGQIWVQPQARWVDTQANPMALVESMASPESLQRLAESGFQAYFAVPVMVVGDRAFDAVPSKSMVTLGDGVGASGTLATSVATEPHLLAVLVFFIETVRPHDQRFTELISGMTTQVGMVLRQKQVEAELKALLVAMTDLMVVLDAQGHCLKVVPNHPISHASALEMLGKSLHETLPLPIAELMLGGIERSLTMQQTVDVEYSLPVHGQDTCFLARISPLTGETVMMVARDITHRKQMEAALQDSEERFRTIFEQAAVGIFLTDMTGQFIRVNQRFCRILGYTEFELLNLTFQDVIHPEDLALSQTYFQQALAGSSTRDALEIRCVCKPEQSRWINLTLSRMQHPSERSAYLIAVAEDIQERKQIEADLQEAKEAAMREAARSADANRTKSEFLANISHELRTPLNAILGFTQLLARDVSLNPEKQGYLDIISRSGEHLLNLINDVLEMSKIEAGRSSLKLSSFDLRYFLQELEDMLRLNAEAKGLQFLFDYGSDIPQYVKADEGKLRQVLINLLGNAIKFTAEGGVTLRLRVAESASPPPVSSDREPFTLLFEVEDTGVGIPPADLETLFDPFVQSKQRLIHPEGTGLGLPISQKFVELMGGSIEVISTPGRGTMCRFDVRVFPSSVVEPLPPKAQQRAIALLPDQPAYRILVVDDHNPSRQLLVNLLRGIGFEVEEATNGEEAIAGWQRWHPHLIWMDMRMPQVDGYEATRRIRAAEAEQNPGIQTTKIIAVTASAFEEDRARVLAAGCDDFVRKPFRDAMIFEKMATHLGVCYLYDQIEVVSSSSPPSHAQLPDNLDTSVFQRMPQEWTQQIHQAAIRGSDEQLLQLFEQIPDDDSTLAYILKNWVLDYQFDRILALTQGISL